jgi:hypothetical protein
MIAILIVIALLAALLFSMKQYSDKKQTSGMVMGTSSNGLPAPVVPNSDQYASAAGVKTTSFGSTKNPMDDPSMLLPKDSDSTWGSVNPQGEGMLKNVGLLSATALAGINTIGTSRKNGNLQLRPEPPNPTGPTGPWNMSSIQPDSQNKTFS